MSENRETEREIAREREGEYVCVCVREREFDSLSILLTYRIV